MSYKLAEINHFTYKNRMIRHLWPIKSIYGIGKNLEAKDFIKTSKVKIQPMQQLLIDNENQ